MDTDKRWKALGESLINYSLAMQPGEKLMIAMYETESYPLALAAYEACIKAGGYPQIQLWQKPEKSRSAYQHADSGTNASDFKRII